MSYSSFFKMVVFAIVLLQCGGCVVFRDNAKYQFKDGVYREKRFGNKRVYVLHIDDDTLAVFPMNPVADSMVVDTKKRINYTPMLSKIKNRNLAATFYKPSLDLDIVTIPLKYRPARYDIPNQLITSFNGAIYAGYRIDEYQLNYKRTPIRTYKQYARHFGYSGGLFMGIGSTVINQQFITDPTFELDYEGVILISGLCVNMATDGLTFGVCVGFDRLLDRNNEYWIYQNRPWVGLSLGLDLY